MASSRNLLNTASKDSPPLHQVCNISLIQRNFNRTRPNKVCCAMNIGKHRVHLSPFQNKKGAAAATPSYLHCTSISPHTHFACHSERSEEPPHFVFAVCSRTNPANPPASTAPSPQSAVPHSGSQVQHPQHLPPSNPPSHPASPADSPSPPAGSFAHG